MADYSGESARNACEAILKAGKNEKYNIPVKGFILESSGFWKENGKWVAYDNSTYDCWVEEFSTRKEARTWCE